ncbi:MAG: EamA family transporter [Bacteroidales bacterium]|jgi:drug/metabolite transporter (DMT)-like permease|nr:EamA family transporter [Bacteroidales bacterium]MDD2280131.1 EamA family transporter [Bacteroidales bacterium]MDD4292681.1 EamA family transporter [Bacteroidales bacterium]MDD4491678.1 EamA family transporter [Bacteroidales bacterium]
MNIIYLIIHILFALGMFISLKIINIKGLNKFLAITINYVIALIFTLITYKYPISTITDYYSTNLILASLWVGVLFIVSFILMIFSTERAGIGLTTALNKMAVVIPVSVGIVYLGQHDNITFKLVGIALALASFVLILYKKETEKKKLSALLLPLSVFLVSGLIDTSMELTNTILITQKFEIELFLMGIFATASIIGIVTIVLDKFWIKTKEKFSYNTILWGAIMGVFNFLVSKMILINVGLMGGSVVFPVHNAAVVSLTALIGVLFFKEKFSAKQWAGVALAVISVIMIAGTL